MMPPTARPLILQDRFAIVLALEGLALLRDVRKQHAVLRMEILCRPRITRYFMSLPNVMFLS